MSKASITNTIVHVEGADEYVTRALDNLFVASANISRAAEWLASANAYISDGNSESVAARLESVKKFQGAVDLVRELQGIQEGLRDHLSSLRGEKRRPDRSSESAP